MTVPCDRYTAVGTARLGTVTAEFNIAVALRADFVVLAIPEKEIRVKVLWVLCSGVHCTKHVRVYVSAFEYCRITYTYNKHI